MNVLASLILIVGSFIAGRIYEYRLNLKECENCDNKRGV
ncbi:putative phage protein [Clostridioides difficile DA00212]|nr:putative phage protein [Clostridioides difficile DA00212]